MWQLAISVASLSKLSLSVLIGGPFVIESKWALTTTCFLPNFVESLSRAVYRAPDGGLIMLQDLITAYALSRHISIRYASCEAGSETCFITVSSKLFKKP